MKCASRFLASSLVVCAVAALTVVQSNAAGTRFELPGVSLFQSDAIRPHCQELAPTDAKVVALRQTTPLFGIGQVEAIPDAQIEAYCTTDRLAPSARRSCATATRRPSRNRRFAA